jgi:tetratricopeptide (TPR) repeat protein
MSRFGNLEFSGNSEKEQQPSSSAGRDEAHYLLEAESLFQRGHFEPALRACAKALEFNPKSTAGWTGQIRSLIELGEFDEAKVWADKGLSLCPDHPELLAAKAVALARSGDLDGAISFSDASIEAPGESPYIWLARGDVLLARSEKRAQYCFEKALALGRGKWIWLWLTARVQLYYKHFARALKHIQDALTLSPTEAVLWVEMGRAQLAMGLPGHAQRSLEQAGELDPELDLSRLNIEATETTFLQKVVRRCRNFLQK